MFFKDIKFKNLFQKHIFSPLGTTAIFFTYGLISLLVLVGFVFVNFYRPEVGFTADLPPEEDPHQVIFFYKSLHTIQVGICLLGTRPMLL